MPVGEKARQIVCRLLRRCTGLLRLLVLTAACSAAQAQISGGAVKIGVLTDTQSIYAHFSGKGSVAAAEMAIEDFGTEILGKPIRLVYADHRNDVDFASKVAQRWLYQEGVDVIADIVGSPIALAVQEINRKRQSVLFFNAVVSADLTGKLCAPTGIHWMYDSHSIAAAIGTAITQRGGKTWFFITLDNAFGTNQERIMAEHVKAQGDTVLGSVRHPLNAKEFLGYLLKAQNSGAQVIALVSAGDDAINALRQASDLPGFLKGDMRLASLINIGDVDRIKLPLAQGLLLHSAFYWDRDEESRKFSQRFFLRTGQMPSDAQAGVYSSVTHYLRSVQAAGTDDGPTVVKKMRELPIKDPVVRNARLREDGRMVHDIYLAQVKKPGESKGPWDYLRLLQTIPGDRAFLALDKSECPQIEKNRR